MPDGVDKEIISEVRGQIGVITLARPERLNALTHKSMMQLQFALSEMGERRDVRAVILCGEGRAFCAGVDLMQGLGDPSVRDPVAAAEAGMRGAAEVVWTMCSIPQPVIVVVQGYAVGGGFALAAAANVRIIGPDAKFSAPFLKLGMTVGDLGLSWFLPRIVGQARASELFFSAGVIDAEQAVAFGLSSRISEDPMADALAFAASLVSFPSYAVETSKRLLNASAISSLRDHLDAEARAQAIGALTEHAKCAMGKALAQSGESTLRD